MGLRDLFGQQPSDEDDDAWGAEPDPVDLDRMLIAELRSSGADLRRPRDTRFFLYFDDRGDAARALDAVRAERYTAFFEETEATHAEPWRVVAWRDMVVDDEAIAEARRVFGRIAGANRGSFRGWEAAATD